MSVIGTTRFGRNGLVHLDEEVIHLVGVDQRCEIPHLKEGRVGRQSVARRRETAENSDNVNALV